jgi:hypothetical protein
MSYIITDLRDFLIILDFCETWYVKREEVVGGWRRLHNEELHNLYASPNIIRVIRSRGMRREGHVARLGEKRNILKFLVGKPEEKRPLGTPRRRCKDNIRLDLR